MRKWLQRYLNSGSLPVCLFLASVFLTALVPFPGAFIMMLSLLGILVSALVQIHRRQWTYGLFNLAAFVSVATLMYLSQGAYPVD